MIKKELYLPVVIIGGGPAGMATAIALARLGIPAVVLETHNIFYKPGEIVSAGAYPFLRQLGIEYTLHDPQHKQNLEHLTAWGSPASEAVHAQAGNGWYINRMYFEKQLRWAAERQKVQWLTGLTFIDYAEREDHISLIAATRDGEQLQIAASFAVDASGRRACLAHEAGASRMDLDGLTSYHMNRSTAVESLPNVSLIESTADGWWQVLPGKNGQLSVNYFTDAALAPVRTEHLTGFIFNKLRETLHLKTWIATPEQVSVAVTNRQASTSILNQLAGRYWLAVGDAAFTTDPILSSGITAAFQSSLQAAISIKDYLGGNSNALGAYASTQLHTLYQYLERLQYQYSLETRWHRHPFWQRRHMLIETLSQTPCTAQPS